MQSIFEISTDIMVRKHKINPTIDTNNVTKKLLVQFQRRVQNSHERFLKKHLRQTSIAPKIVKKVSFNSQRVLVRWSYWASSESGCAQRSFSAVIPVSDKVGTQDFPLLCCAWGRHARGGPTASASSQSASSVAPCPCVWLPEVDKEKNQI